MIIKKINKKILVDTYFDKSILSVDCGEIPLCELDSCRLMVLNLYSYVDRPFTKEAMFNFDKFLQHVIIAQRLMDDMIDLEIESLNKIIKKIKSDPESLKLKEREIQLWEKIKDKAIQGRRTGLGITGLGDMLASLNIGYATNEAIVMTDLVYDWLKLGSYTSSVEMAKEI